MGKKSFKDALLNDLQLDTVLDKIKGKITQFEKGIDDRIHVAMDKLSLTTQPDMDKLTKKIDDLSKRVDKLIKNV